MSEQPLRVLLVDDEAGFTEVLAKRLRRRGLDVLVALSGAEAPPARHLSKMILEFLRKLCLFCHHIFGLSTNDL